MNSVNILKTKWLLLCLASMLVQPVNAQLTRSSPPKSKNIWRYDQPILEFPVAPEKIKQEQIKHFRVRTPYSIARKIIHHSTLMKSRGYFKSFSESDFFHGHMILRKWKNSYSSPEDFFENVTAILYHTAEREDRWEAERARGIPPEKRNPRSLIGWPDGTVEKAINYINIEKMLRPTKKQYLYSGGIVISTILRHNPEWSEITDWNMGSRHKYPLVQMGPQDSPLKLFVRYQILIQPDINGRFQLSESSGNPGPKIDVFFAAQTIDRGQRY